MRTAAFPADPRFYRFIVEGPCRSDRATWTAVGLANRPQAAPRYPLLPERAKPACVCGRCVTFFQRWG